MKKIALLICFIIISQAIYAQNINEIKQKIDSIISLNVEEAPIVVSVPTKADSIKAIVMAEKWDNINFNPYVNQLTKFPFQIEFQDSTYVSPIKGKKVVTSRYGWRRGRPHRGIDIDLVTGDSVVAMFDGIVRFARYSSGHGKTVIIRHYNGLETAYAHLSKYSVKANDTIKRGDVVGLGGKTGNARGSHLHLIISYKGNYVNPEYLFNFSEENKIRDQHIWVTKKWVAPHFHTSVRQSKLDLFCSYHDALEGQKKDDRKKVYVVKRGDTLSGISSKHRVSLSRLCKTNAIRKTSTLKIGQKLVINQ